MLAPINIARRKVLPLALSDGNVTKFPGPAANEMFVLTGVKVQIIMRKQVFLATIGQTPVAPDRLDLGFDIGCKIENSVQLGKNDIEIVAIKLMDWVVAV